MNAFRKAPRDIRECGGVGRRPSKRFGPAKRARGDAGDADGVGYRGGIDSGSGSDALARDERSARVGQRVGSLAQVYSNAHAVVPLLKTI